MKQLTLVGLSALIAFAVLLPSNATAHERKEVAGLVVVFGAEPEPALTGEIENLRWRFQSSETQESFADLEDVKAVITRDGKEYGPFEARRSRGEPGVVQTRHIFSEPGEYEVALTFRKEGDPELHTIAFTYNIRDRRDLEIPGSAGFSSAQASSQASEAIRIDVTMDEFSFSPARLRIPAGRPVTLVIRNVGKVAHELMAGRDVEGNDFKQDLFADLHVNIEKVEMAADHGDHALGAEGEQAAVAEHDHGAAQDDAQAEHAHGTMVESQPGETFLMTFTLPEDRRGEWITGCFLSGHYEAGMHGTLVVE